MRSGRKVVGGHVQSVFELSQQISMGVHDADRLEVTQWIVFGRWHQLTH